MRIYASLSYSIFMTILFIFIGGCAQSNEPVLKEDEPKPSHGALYARTQQKIRESMSQLVHQFGYPYTRNLSEPLTGSEIVGFLTGLPKEKVDSLYKKECTPEREACEIANFNTIVEVLEDMTSEREVTNLFDFVESYIKIGGNSPSTLRGGYPKFSRALGGLSSRDFWLGLEERCEHRDGRPGQKSPERDRSRVTFCPVTGFSVRNITSYRISWAISAPELRHDARIAPPLRH